MPNHSYDVLLAENEMFLNALAETGGDDRSSEAGARIYEKYGWTGLNELASPIFEAAEFLMKNGQHSLANRLLKGLIQ